MTQKNRANPLDELGDLSDFKASGSQPKKIDRSQIDEIAESTGFPSRQAVLRPQSTARPARKYTTGRNQQINIKVTAEVADKLYRLADEAAVPLGRLVELALNAYEKHCAKD